MHKMTCLKFLRLLLVVQLVFALPSFAQVVGSKPALVIIDMQEPFITRGGQAERSENVQKVKTIIEEQLKLIKQAKAEGMPIIFMEYTDFGPTNSRLKAAVEGYSDTRTFLKNTDGMFDPSNQYLPELSSYLQEKEVGSLVIAGANGGACVERSISGALENNFSVTAMSPDIADFNYDDFIYPYNDMYSFPPQCPAPQTCTFREIDSLPALILSDALKPRPVTTTGVDESDRSVNSEAETGSNTGESAPSTPNAGQR